MTKSLFGLGKWVASGVSPQVTTEGLFPTIEREGLLGDWKKKGYPASAAAPYPLGFIHLDLDENTFVIESQLWKVRFLREEPLPWLGILASQVL